MSRIFNRISEKKQKQIDQFNATDFSVGEKVYVPNYLVSYSKNDDGKTDLMKILTVNKDTIEVCSVSDKYPSAHTIDKSLVNKRYSEFDVGFNPFDTKYDTVRAVAFSLESILFTLNILDEKRSTNELYVMNGVSILECNWNPYIYNKEGKKEYYQRDFVWSLEDKQLLVESIYNQIDCGKILIRKRGWDKLEKLANNGETELAFNDIVDGKQRLNALRGFLANEYPDAHGNYYGDLSTFAQNKFTNNHLFTYAEMPERTTDEEVIYQFLKLNFTGVPQSKEHIEFVKNIQTRV